MQLFWSLALVASMVMDIISLAQALDETNPHRALWFAWFILIMGMGIWAYVAGQREKARRLAALPKGIPVDPTLLLPSQLVHIVPLVVQWSAGEPLDVPNPEAVRSLYITNFAWGPGSPDMRLEFYVEGERLPLAVMDTAAMLATRISTVPRVESNKAVRGFRFRATRDGVEIPLTINLTANAVYPHPNAGQILTPKA